MLSRNDRESFLAALLGNVDRTGEVPYNNYRFGNTENWHENENLGFGGNKVVSFSRKYRRGPFDIRPFCAAPLDNLWLELSECRSLS